MPDSQMESEQATSSAKSSWRLIETRALAPFPQERHALDGTAFTPYEGTDPDTSRSVYFVPEDFDPEDFRPSFNLQVDAKKLEETTDFDAGALVLSVTARDHATKNYRCLQTWNLDDVPPTYECAREDLTGLSLLQRVTFCVIVSIPNDIPREFGKPHFQASVLAEKRFTIQKEPESPSFPTKPKPPEFFEKRGLPGDTLWLVDQGADVQAPPEEAVTVYINENAVKKLNKAFSGNVAGGLLKNQLASEIFFDVCVKAFSEKPSEPPEDGSLIGMLLSCFRKFDLTLPQLGEMAEERGGFRLRCFVQSHLKLTHKIEVADLRRPWKR